MTSDNSTPPRRRDAPAALPRSARPTGRRYKIRYRSGRSPSTRWQPATSSRSAGGRPDRRVEQAVRADLPTERSEPRTWKPPGASGSPGTSPPSRRVPRGRPWSWWSSTRSRTRPRRRPLAVSGGCTSAARGEQATLDAGAARPAGDRPRRGRLPPGGDADRRWTNLRGERSLRRTLAAAERPAARHHRGHDRRPAEGQPRTGRSTAATARRTRRDGRPGPDRRAGAQGPQPGALFPPAGADERRARPAGTARPGSTAVSRRPARRRRHADAPRRAPAAPARRGPAAA